jgi:integrase/recombinase XerC
VPGHGDVPILDLDPAGYRTMPGPVTHNQSEPQHDGPARSSEREITLAAARQEYLDSLAERNRAHATSATYAYAIDRFLAFLQRGEPDLEPLDGSAPLRNVTDEHVRRFARQMYRARLAAVTRKTYLVVLRNWFRHLRTRGYVCPNPDAIELPDTPERLPQPDERLERVFEVTPEARTETQRLINLRDRAILETLFSTQLRVSELVALNRTSIDWERGQAIVRGKGRKVRTIFFSERAIAALNAYLDARQDDYEPLFIHHDRAHRAAPSDRRGECMRLTRQSVEAIVRKYARLAGVQATPHSFRHYGATQLLRNGADIRTVQELLGHASVSTTQIYTHVAPRRLEHEWRRFHPANAPHRSQE